MMRYQVIDDNRTVLVECDKVRLGCGVILFYIEDVVVANIKNDILYYISNSDRQWHEYDAKLAEIRGLL